MTVRDNLLDKKKVQGPPNASFVQIHGKVRSKDDDLTVDEQAEMSLKLTAHSMTKQASMKDSRDKVLKGLLQDSGIEQNLKK